MNERILSVLDIVHESVSPSLINDDGYERLEALAGMLPLEFAAYWGLECRLGRPEALADILFRITKRSQAQRLLAGNSSSLMDGICDKWPVWQNLRGFAKQWADPKHPFHDRIRNLWMEFDTAAMPAGMCPEDIIPSLFLGPESSSIKKERLFDLISDILSSFDFTYSGSPILKMFIESLPQGWQLFQVGLMISRPGSGLRVCVNCLSLKAIPGWLSEINWKGDIDTLTELLNKINPMVQSIALGLNLTEAGPEENIGIECYINQVENESEQWIPLLEYLDEMDLCLPEKRKELLDFAGAGSLPVHSWKNNDRVYKPTYFHRVHHVKLGFVGDRVAEAKAYLLFCRPGILMYKTSSKRCFGG